MTTKHTTVEGVGVQRPPNADSSASRRERRHGAVIMAAGGVWVIAGVLIVAGPAGVTAARVYGTAVPLAVALLLVGATGVRLRLGGPEQPPSWWAGFRAMWRRLDNVLDTGHDHRRGRGLRDVPGTSTSTRVGLFTLRAGCVAVVAASLLPTGSENLSWRPTLWFGWFLLYAGTAALGVAVVTTDELPRGSGVLLLVASLPVFQAATMTAVGGARQPESLGPLVPLALTTPARVTLAMVLWLLFGAAWGWLGWALWSQRTGA